MSDKEDPVAKDHRYIIGGMAFIVVFFLIVISIYGVANDPEPLEHPDPWYVYIVRFQTLIGGLLAVGAAFITIRQMRVSDEKADKHHGDLMDLQSRELRADFDTLKNLYSDEVLDCQFLIQGRVKFNVREASYAEIGKYARDCYRIAMRIQRMARSEGWSDYARVTNGEMRSVIHFVNQVTEDIHKQLWKVMDSPGNEVVNFITDESPRLTAAILKGRMELIEDNLSVLTEELDRDF